MVLQFLESRIEEKEKYKIEKYRELERKLQKILNVKVKIIPSFVGSLGAIPKQFGNRRRLLLQQENTSSEDSFTWNG